MALPLGAIVEVTYLSTLFSQRIMNVLHYVVTNESTTVSPVQEMEDLAGTFAANGVGDILPAYLACLPENLVVDLVRCQAILPTRYRAINQVINEQGLLGTASTANVQGSITKTTTFSGRDQIGSIHLPLASESISGGLVTGGTRTLMDALADELKVTVTEDVGGGAYAPVLFHRNPLTVPRYSLITEMVPQTTSRVMRRRTVGLGV